MKSTDFTLRGYRPEQLTHHYRKRELADPSVRWLVPWCEFDRDPQQRHERPDIDTRAVARYRPCPECTNGGGRYGLVDRR